MRTAAAEIGLGGANGITSTPRIVAISLRASVSDFASRASSRSKTSMLCSLISIRSSKVVSASRLSLVVWMRFGRAMGSGLREFARRYRFPFVKLKAE